MNATPRPANGEHTTYLRQPPHSLEAEQSVLGGLMLSTGAWDSVAGIISEQDFYRKDNRLIFRAIAELAERNEPFDPITLGDWFEANDLIDEIGGAAALVELANNTPSAANIVHYATIVRGRALLRELIDTSTHITTSAYQPEGKTPQEIIEAAERDIYAVADAGKRGRRSVVKLADTRTSVMRVVQERYESQGALIGISTGYPDLDEKTAGLQRGDLIIIAGRPSMGKTAIAMNFAEHAALHERKKVLFFSMEMSEEQLSMRCVASIGRINSQRLRTGTLEDEEWPRMTSAMTKMGDMPLWIVPSPSQSPTQVRATARRVNREADGLDLIVLDYLQLMQVPGNKENRATEIAEISRNLKALARELNVPVVALSQLNRSLESRTDKRPIMADLRESGAIEQDADLIMFLYRDEYYHKDSEDKGLAEVIIGKQRNGPTGVVTLAFRGEYSRFESYSPEHDYYG